MAGINTAQPLSSATCMENLGDTSRTVQAALEWFGFKCIERPRLSKQIFVIALWFGLLTGMLEGAGLLIFQHINWPQWGIIPHVSAAILWISPLCDVLIFISVVLLVAAVAWLFGSDPVRSGVRVLVFLTIFDLLGVTWSFYYSSILLFAVGATIAFDRWWRHHDQSTLRLFRTTCPWLLGLWLIIACVTEGGSWLRERQETANLPSAEAGSPNVILIVIDTLRADHLGCYGYSRPTTPNIDRIAKQGVRFENAIAASSWTFPSHASLLTGRYPSEHGMQGVEVMRWGGGAASQKSYVTLGEALQQKGYRTAAFSANQILFTSTVGLDKGFIHFEDYFQSPRDMFMRTFFGRDGLVKVVRQLVGLKGWMYSYKSAADVNSEALHWISKDSRPFLAVLNYFGVHEADAREWSHIQPAWGTDSQVNRYDSALFYADQQIGRLIEELERRGLLKNTVLIITSDHGQGLGQHQMFAHGSALYLEQIRIPLIFSFPNHLPTGRRVSTPVSNSEIAATVMDLAVSSTGPFPTPSLSPLWRANASHPEYPAVISELEQNEIMDARDKVAHTRFPNALDGNMRSVLTSRWHLIEHQTRGEQLYDWVNDPGELNNVIDTVQGHAIAKDLELQTSHAHTLSAKARIHEHPVAWLQKTDN